MTQTDFNFEPRKTQCELILSHLQSGGTLTVLEALQLFQCYALSQRIGTLKRMGHPIKSEMVKVGSGKKVARYSMERS